MEAWVGLFKLGENRMGIRDVAWRAIKWKFIKNRLGYNDEEMKMFRENPRNENVLNMAPEFQKKTIVVEIVDSHGCDSQHKVGDIFYFDGAGNLLTCIGIDVQAKKDPAGGCLLGKSRQKPVEMMGPGSILSAKRG